MSEQQQIPSVNVGYCPFCKVNDNYVERIHLSTCAVICDCGAQGPELEPEDEHDLKIEEDQDLNPGHVAAVRAWQAVWNDDAGPRLSNEQLRALADSMDTAQTAGES